MEFSDWTIINKNKMAALELSPSETRYRFLNLKPSMERQTKTKCGKTDYLKT